jgi:hypothetical protein
VDRPLLWYEPLAVRRQDVIFKYASRAHNSSSTMQLYSDRAFCHQLTHGHTTRAS